ncbi:Uncharacterized protein Fot_23029 [Forsythia ovata]|uniref:starch synthase n=1 Tax=Forsythia ovata TaxID=205694 RepID=A0ABD1UZD9_9LAMI
MGLYLFSELRGHVDCTYTIKKNVDNVWYIEPSKFKDEDKVKLYYNRILGPLAHAKDVSIHGGLNNWKDELSIVSKLIRLERKDGDWWYANGECDYEFFLPCIMPYNCCD